ncbi:ATP-binding protein [Desulfurispirillum indicum]|uniref:ATP-binding protein n=1 Tax=Desulfurispirillum indicum TaxID=936456 RepID=UPI001CFBC292|nr:ATP-binding protein [Desulfurispirillum indicum]UCZ57242.1 ATP-binding protein [Desulfurispirillum indicum]
MKEKIELDISVPNQTRYLSLIGRIGEEIARTLEHYEGDRDELAYHINLVLTEATTNAIRHGNEGNPDKDVHITITIAEDLLHIRVYDHGQGFDISTLPEPDFDFLEDHGRGIFVIRSLMDRVSYLPSNGGYVLEMTKRLL